jgi:uncharacterized protein (TIGR02246 family)
MGRRGRRQVPGVHGPLGHRVERLSWLFLSAHPIAASKIVTGIDGSTGEREVPVPLASTFPFQDLFMRTTLAVLGLTLTLAACASPPPPPPVVDLAAEEAAIRAADAAWMVAAGARDAAGEAAVMAEDGMAFREMSDPLSGPAAYQAFLTKYYTDNPKAVSTWATRSLQVAASGDLAVQTGSYTETGGGPKGDKESHGNFVTVWKKVNGQWKVATDMGQVIPPAAKP